MFIANYSWGKYVAGDEGADVCISSWSRMAPNTMPALAKAGGNYLNSQLIRMEADSNGYSEGIALDVFGNLSEGSGENLFVVRNGVIYTTPLANSVLSGITRDSVLTMARHLGIPVVEQAMPRELLYIADEAFFTGTAAEVHPIRSVDRIPDRRRHDWTDQQAAFRGVPGHCPWAAAGSVWVADTRQREYQPTGARLSS